MTEIRDSLAQVQELLGRATDGRWYVEPMGENEFGQKAYSVNMEDDRIPTVESGEFYGDPHDANAAVAAVNFLRTHGPALLAMMEDHSPDAGKMGEDAFWHAGTQRPEPMTCDETGCTTGLVLVIHAPDDGGPSVRQGRYDHCLRGFFDSTTSQRIDPDQWTFAPQEAARAGERGVL